MIRTEYEANVYMSTRAPLWTRPSRIQRPTRRHGIIRRLMALFTS